MKTADVIAFCDFHEAYLSKYIQQADVKAGAVFAAAAGVIGFLISNRSFLGALTGEQSCLALAIAWGTVALLGTSAGMSFFVIAPRRATSGSDLVFWKSVAGRQDGPTFAAALETADLTDIARQRASHCFDLAKVCNRKFDLLSLAMKLGGIAAIAATVSIFMLTDKRAPLGEQKPETLVAHQTQTAPATTIGTITVATPRPLLGTATEPSDVKPGSPK